MVQLELIILVLRDKHEESLEGMQKNSHNRTKRLCREGYTQGKGESNRWTDSQELIVPEINETLIGYKIEMFSTILILMDPS